MSNRLEKRLRSLEGKVPARVKPGFSNVPTADLHRGMQLMKTATNTGVWPTFWEDLARDAPTVYEILDQYQRNSDNRIS